MALDSDHDPNTPDQSQDIAEGLISLSSDQLRRAIRDVVTEFNSSVIPVRPSPSEILTPFMLENSARFTAVTGRISELLREGANPRDEALTELFNERDELCSVAISSESFKEYRSSRMAEHNARVSRFNEMQDVIVGLKPFLGMPSLPAVRVPSIDPAVILTAIRGVATREPMAGQMVLRVDEPYYQRKMFWPLSIADTGIDPRLAKDFVPVPYALDSTQAKCADSFGAVMRMGAFSFPIVKRKPSFDGAWGDIDAFLPFALRSLCVPVVPLVLPQSAPDLHDIFRDDTVQALKNKALQSSNGRCVYCGSSHEVDIIGVWRFREPLEGATPIGVQMLSHVWTACLACKQALRPSVTKLGLSSANGVSSINPAADIVERLGLLNHWPTNLAVEYARSAYAISVESFKRRSLLRWILDLKSINRQYLVLNDGLSVSSSGWINDDRSHDGESSFRLTGAGIHDPSHTRFFFSAPSIFDVKWDDTVESVSQRLADYDLSVIEKARPEDAFASVTDTATVASSSDFGPNRDEPEESAFARAPAGAGMGSSGQNLAVVPVDNGETFLLPADTVPTGAEIQDQDEEDDEDVDDVPHVSKRPVEDDEDEDEDVDVDEDEEAPWGGKYA